MNPILPFLASILALAAPAPEGRPWFGEPLPGPQAGPFAPGLVALGYHEHRIAIAPDGREIYWSVASPDRSQVRILVTRLQDRHWTVPEAAPFSDRGANLHPAFSPDGQRLYFASTRTSEKDGKLTRDADIWVVTRRGAGWTEPEHLGPAVNTRFQESSPVVMADGSLLFESGRNEDKGDWDIYRARCVAGVLQPAEKLPAPVNTTAQEGGPCMTPDGRCLVFHSNRPGGLGDTDLYAAFLRPDGSWSDPANLGAAVNSAFLDWSPGFSPDGRYLFFSSYRNLDPLAPRWPAFAEALGKAFGPPKPGLGTLYWLDARALLDRLRPKP